jgi:hypothetical protein
MYKALKNFLNAPYPVYTSYKRVIGIAVVVSLFVAVFLFLFQPFGLSAIQGDYRLWVIASFGLPCFPIILMGGLITTYFSRRYDWEKYWKVYHEIITTSFIPVLIGGANYLYGYILFDKQFSWAGLMQMQRQTFILSFFPIVGVITMDWILLVKKHQLLADFFNRTEYNPSSDDGPPGTCIQAHENNEIVLEGENKQESIRMVINELLFIKAEGNYVDVVTAKHQEQPKNCLLRNSLKAIESQLEPWNNRIVRCHRSYLVNCHRIRKAHGNAQGLALSLESSEQEIPVSRKYVDCFRDSCRDAVDRNHTPDHW